MEKWQIAYITAKKPKLIEVTECNNVVLTELEARGQLAKIECQQLTQILRNGSEMDQATALYNKLVTRTNAYDTLIEVLELPSVKQDGAAKILRDGKISHQLEQGSHSMAQVPNTTNHLGVEGGPSGSSNVAPLPSFGPASTDVVDGSIVEKYKSTAVDNKLTVKVERPIQDMMEQFKNKDHYKLPYEKKGYALILNIINFDKHVLKEGEPRDPSEPNLTRYGAENDAVNMRALWKEFGYEIFREAEIEWGNGIWYKKKLLRIIEDFKEYCDERKPDSIVVFIGSHGESNTIITSDAPKTRTLKSNAGNSRIEYDYHYESIRLEEDVVFQFYHSEEHGCPGLIGKPKLFLVSACQTFKPPQTDAVNGPVSDLLVCTAQVPGYAAFRDPENGSWFATCVAYVFMNYAKEKSLTEMMKMVQDIMEGMPKNPGHLRLPDGRVVSSHHGQVPRIADGGMKELYFNLKQV